MYIVEKIKRKNREQPRGVEREKPVNLLENYW
jgi:hypothetical protein